MCTDSELLLLEVYLGKHERNLHSRVPSRCKSLPDPRLPTHDSSASPTQDYRTSCAKARELRVSTPGPCERDPMSW